MQLTCTQVAPVLLVSPVALFIVISSTLPLLGFLHFSKGKSTALSAIDPEAVLGNLLQLSGILITGLT